MFSVQETYFFTQIQSISKDIKLPSHLPYVWHHMNMSCMDMQDMVANIG